MPATLTPAQRRDAGLDHGEPGEVIDPATGARYRLVPAGLYDELQSLREHDAWAAAAADTLGRRLAEDEAGEGGA